MISTHYICNGCGLYTSYAGKNETQLNELQVDLTNYLILTSGFIMKNPEVKIHFCDKCYSEVIKGEGRVKSLGETETMRIKISKLEEEKEKIFQDFSLYKSQIKHLLKNAL